MSIIRTELYGNYAIKYHTPGWIKAERYDYCEPFFEESPKSKKGLRFLAQLFLSIL